jgi:hypothetical protein
LLNTIENRMMKDFLPHIERVHGSPEVAKSQSLQDYTSKDSGGESYTGQEYKGYSEDPGKKYFDKLKKYYQDTTELQLRLTEKVRMQLREYGQDLFLIMVDYYNKV